jgi:hypothetical protein
MLANFSLSKKYLGVPVVYYAGLFVGILLVVAWKMKSADTTAVDGDVPATDANGVTDILSPDGVGGDGNYDGFIANPPPAYTQVATPAGAGTTVDTNDAWLSRGVAWSVSKGLATAGTAQDALSSYLNGNQLSYAQGQIRDAVIKEFGLPPEVPTPGGTSPEPAKRQGNPPTYHTVKGASDNDLGKLVGLYYGGSNVVESLRLIQISNPKIPMSGPYPVGTRIFIPAYHQPTYYTATKLVSTLHQFAVKGNTTSQNILTLNNGLGVTFPAKVGTRVRIS